MVSTGRAHGIHRMPRSLPRSADSRCHTGRPADPVAFFDAERSPWFSLDGPIDSSRLRDGHQGMAAALQRPRQRGLADELASYLIPTYEISEFAALQSDPDTIGCLDIGNF